MKRIYLLALLATQSATGLFAQAQTNKPDTMTIRIGGEHISLPVPKEGNKTTINLEDSANIIQISVAKTAKNKIGPAVPLPKNLPAPKNRRSKVSWFNEVDFGAMVLLGKRKGYFVDDSFAVGTGIGTYTYMYSNFVDYTGKDRATIIRLTPKDIKPGFTLGLSVREKSRPIFKSDFSLLTGFRLRYSRYVSTGDYDRREIKVKTDSSGFVRFYPDSVYSKRVGQYKTSNSIVSVVVPFIIEKQLKTNSKYTMKLAAGFNLVGNLIFSRTSQISMVATNLTDAEMLTFQPIVRFSVNRTSLYMSYNFKKTILGYGSTEKIQGNFGLVGLAYKLY